jgi:hypothetical protein
MKILVRKPESVRHAADVSTLRADLNQADGYDASDSDIEWAWKCHSASRCAGWLAVDGYNQSERVAMLLRYLTPKEKDQ